MTKTSTCSGKSVEYRCPVEATLKLIGGKYKALILWHLIDGPLRHSALSRALSTATAKMLTQQLRELERDELVSRKIYDVIPPKVEYSLTDYGRTLIPILDALCDWGKEYLERQQ